jgi:hypothetical protein
MNRLTISGISLVAGLAAVQPAAAGSWSFGVGVETGPPVYYGPPPVYYGPPPVVYDAPPPPVYHPAPVLVAPPPVVLQIATPDQVLDSLEAAGYREMTPMAHRGPLFKLNAVNRDGDLVALEIATESGMIERELILQPGYRPPLQYQPRAVAAPAPLPAPAPPATAGDPLVVY